MTEPRQIRLARIVIIAQAILNLFIIAIALFIILRQMEETDAARAIAEETAVHKQKEIEQLRREVDRLKAGVPAPEPNAPPPGPSDR